MESQPQNSEFRNDLESCHPCLLHKLFLNLIKIYMYDGMNKA